METATCHDWVSYAITAHWRQRGIFIDHPSSRQRFTLAFMIAIFAILLSNTHQPQCMVFLKYPHSRLSYPLYIKCIPPPPPPSSQWMSWVFLELSTGFISFPTSLEQLSYGTIKRIILITHAHMLRTVFLCL